LFGANLRSAMATRQLAGELGFIMAPQPASFTPFFTARSRPRHLLSIGPSHRDRTPPSAIITSTCTDNFLADGMQSCLAHPAPHLRLRGFSPICFTPFLRAFLNYARTYSSGIRSEESFSSDWRATNQKKRLPQGAGVFLLRRKILTAVS
jgi:hypothetical protein